MKICPNCGAENGDAAKFCVRCGQKMEPVHQAPPYQAPTYQEPPYSGGRQAQPQPNIVINNVNDIPEEYRPISMWGYFGYELLFMIPIIGFILLIVFSVGGTRNINLRNFARSYFCILIIFIVLLVFIAVIGGTAALRYSGVYF